MVSIRFSNKSLMLTPPSNFGHSLHSRWILKAHCERVWKIRSRRRGEARDSFSPHLLPFLAPPSLLVLLPSFLFTPGALLLRSLVRSVRLGKERKWLIRRRIGEMEPVGELSKMLSVWHVTGGFITTAINTKLVWNQDDSSSYIATSVWKSLLWQRDIQCLIKWFWWEESVYEVYWRIGKNYHHPFI